MPRKACASSTGSSGSRLRRWPKFEADLQAAILTQAVEKEKLERYRRQIAASRILAPQAGEVVYSTEESNRSGTNQIAEGASIRERQTIIKLPDLNQMKVDMRVHESLISRIREGLSARVRVDAMPGKVFAGKVQNVSSVPVAGSWYRPDLKEYSCTIGHRLYPRRRHSTQAGPHGRSRSHCAGTK